MLRRDKKLIGEHGSDIFYTCLQRHFRLYIQSIYMYMYLGILYATVCMKLEFKLCLGLALVFFQVKMPVNILNALLIFPCMLNIP
jgi:hypothetical protein